MNKQLLQGALTEFYRCVNEISIVAAALEDFDCPKLAAKLDKIADTLDCTTDLIRHEFGFNVGLNEG